MENRVAELEKKALAVAAARAEETKEVVVEETEEEAEAADMQQKLASLGGRFDSLGLLSLMVADGSDLELPQHVLRRWEWFGRVLLARGHDTFGQGFRMTEGAAMEPDDVHIAITSITMPAVKKTAKQGRRERARKAKQEADRPSRRATLFGTCMQTLRCSARKGERAGAASRMEAHIGTTDKEQRMILRARCMMLQYNKGVSVKQQKHLMAKAAHEAAKARESKEAAEAAKAPAGGGGALSKLGGNGCKSLWTRAKFKIKAQAAFIDNTRIRAGRKAARGVARRPPADTTDHFMTRTLTLTQVLRLKFDPYDLVSVTPSFLPAKDKADAASANLVRDDDVTNEFYTDKLLMKRESLFWEKRIQAELQSIWRLSDADGSGGIDSAEYRRMHAALCSVLMTEEEMGEQTRESLKKLAVADWVLDSKGAGYLDYKKFVMCFFELADRYTDGVDEKEYIAFLGVVLEALRAAQRKRLRRMQALNAKRMARGLAKLGDDYDSDAESEGVSDVGDDEAQWQTIIEDNAVNIMENTDGRNATGNARVGDEGKGSAESTDGTGNLGKDEGTDDAGAGLEMKVGSRVARGPDWQADFSDEDGRKLLVRTGDRALGTVTILVTHTSDPNARSVRVNWDLTGDPLEGRLYRFGADVREVVLEADAPEEPRTEVTAQVFALIETGGKRLYYRTSQEEDKDDEYHALSDAPIRCTATHDERRRFACLLKGNKDGHYSEDDENMFRTTVSVVILRRRDSSFNPCLDLLDELAAQQPDNFSPFSPSLAEARDIAEEKQREPKQAGDLNLEINKEHVSQARTVVKLFDYGSRDDAQLILLSIGLTSASIWPDPGHGLQFHGRRFCTSPTSPGLGLGLPSSPGLELTEGSGSGTRDGAGMDLSGKYGSGEGDIGSGVGDGGNPVGRSQSGGGDGGGALRALGDSSNRMADLMTGTGDGDDAGSGILTGAWAGPGGQGIEDTVAGPSRARGKWGGQGEGDLDVVVQTFSMVDHDEGSGVVQVQGRLYVPLASRWTLGKQQVEAWRPFLDRPVVASLEPDNFAVVADLLSHNSEISEQWAPVKSKTAVIMVARLGHTFPPVNPPRSPSPLPVMNSTQRQQHRRQYLQGGNVSPSTAQGFMDSGGNKNFARDSLPRLDGLGSPGSGGGTPKHNGAVSLFLEKKGRVDKDATISVLTFDPFGGPGTTMSSTSSALAAMVSVDKSAKPIVYGGGRGGRVVRRGSQGGRNPRNGGRSVTQRPANQALTSPKRPNYSAVTAQRRGVSEGSRQGNSTMSTSTVSPFGSDPDAEARRTAVPDTFGDVAEEDSEAPGWVPVWESPVAPKSPKVFHYGNKRGRSGRPSSLGAALGRPSSSGPGR